MSAAGICPVVCQLLGWRCQLPVGHDGDHVHETDIDRVTWRPIPQPGSDRGMRR